MLVSLLIEELKPSQMELKTRLITLNGIYSQSILRIINTDGIHGKLFGENLCQLLPVKFSIDGPSNEFIGETHLCCEIDRDFNEKNIIFWISPCAIQELVLSLLN